MTVYLDSSAIVKLYVPEPDSPEVANYVQRLEVPIPFSHLHELEVKNALRLRVFRKEASARPVALCIRMIDKDMNAGVLQRPQLDWLDVFRMAAELSRKFSSRSGGRSLDLLHIASCLVLSCRDFLTFDPRQAAIAKKARIRLIDLH